MTHRPASTRCSPTRRPVPTPSPTRYAGKLAEIDGARPRHRHARTGGDRGDRRPRRHVRPPRLQHRHAVAGQRRAAAARRGEGHRDRDQAAVLPPRVGGAGRREGRGAARHRRAGLRPPPPGDGAPLSPASAERARGAHPRREAALRPVRVDAPVRGADGGDHRRPRRRRGAARRRALEPVQPGPRGAQGRRRARHGGAAARAAHARLRVQHAARGQDGRRPAARLPALAGRAQPVATRRPTSPCRR